MMKDIEFVKNEDFFVYIYGEVVCFYKFLSIYYEVILLF